MTKKSEEHGDELNDFIQELEHLEASTGKLGTITGIAGVGSAVSAALGLALSAVPIFPVTAGLGAVSLWASMGYFKNRKQSLQQQLEALKISNKLTQEQYEDLRQRIANVLVAGPGKAA